MTSEASNQGNTPPTGAIALADGTVFLGEGSGATGVSVGELCFNTAVTGYQEILTDPSYAGQLVLFTFPHIGNVGANPEDHEESTIAAAEAAKGAIFRAPITPPANWRSVDHFDAWLKKKNIIGLSGVDTRALTKRIREQGMPKAAIAHAPEGQLDLNGLIAAAQAWEGLENADLAADVSQDASYDHSEGLWDLTTGFGALNDAEFHVVVVDFGVKKNILRNLAGVGARATIVSGDTSAQDIQALAPDGVVFSNGPGDPAATFERSGKMISDLVASGLPILGICLGHQMLALSLGRENDEDGSGPPRRKPSRERSCNRQSRDRLDEPWVHGRRIDAARRRKKNLTARSSTERIQDYPLKESRSSPCNITRRPAPALKTVSICLSVLLN